MAGYSRHGFHKEYLPSEELKTLSENNYTLLHQIIFPQVFFPLSSVLRKKKEFFPSKQLFEHDLIFFTPSEQVYIEKIEQSFLDPINSNIFLLIGRVASGKTLMSIHIAKKLEKEGFFTLYHKMNAKTNLDRLFSSFCNYANSKTLFVIDDCHLNIEIASEICNRFDHMKDLNCLLCSRPVPKNIRQIANFDYHDFFSDIEEKGNVFSLNTVDVSTKMSGIIEKYKMYLEKESGYVYVVGDQNQIIEKAKGNYLMLYFYLSFWKANEPLSELDETRVLNKMYERYLGNATN